MQNTSFCFPLVFLSSPSNPPPSSLPSSHGKNPGVMFLHASIYLSSFLLLLHFISLLLTKIFSFFCHQAIYKREVQICNHHTEDRFISSPTNSEVVQQKQEIIADVLLGGEALHFLYGGSREKDSTILVDQGKHSKEQILHWEDDSFVHESEYGSPVEDLDSFENPPNDYSDIPATDKPLPSDCLVPIVSVSHHAAFYGVHTNNAYEESLNQEKHNTDENSCRVSELKKDYSKDEKLFTVGNSHSQCKQFKPEEVHREWEPSGGSLTGESTSKSSIEWKSSTIFQDSDIEYPFTSSSRRSTSNWESYTMFRKYDEDMMFFDRISAQKLSEAESFRSINAQPRSISKRIVIKLMAKHWNHSMRMRDPYQVLESAYVAQVCLAWEALNWNYNNFRRAKSRKDVSGSACPAPVAQRFQQFQVLLQRFIENEPYEFARRPEVFAKMRLSCPKLLQVPEFRGDEEKEDLDTSISSAEFLSILDDAIQTFTSFLKAEKKTTCERLRAFINKRQNSVDMAYLRLLVKINKKKRLRLKELWRRRKYSKKRKAKDEQEMETLMAMTDMTVVSRVLRVQDITEEQLHWCEEKMSQVRVWNAQMQRDYSPLFFPVH